MEPLDTDYMVREPRPATPGSRMNVLLMFPILGFLLLLIFIASAVFQFGLSDLIDFLMFLMMVFFVLMIGLLFWALAPQAHKQ